MKPLYCLDSDTVSLHQDGNTNIARRVHEREGEVVVSVITVEEAITGWYSLLRKARNRHQTVFAYKALTETVAFFGSLPILTLDEPALKSYNKQD